MEFAFDINQYVYWPYVALVLLLTFVANKWSWLSGKVSPRVVTWIVAVAILLVWLGLDKFVIQDSIYFFKVVTSLFVATGTYSLVFKPLIEISEKK